eukprot:TRINITY_DN5226_c0_g1_i8.p1 TRINITY_DN5226_c0_g1~~TRINITY_DN5226_c0_g1_i8.p1  ORF type:complete len:138 (-),score=16.95 TRINITY_DN5226_c0_g1_i8:49-462(-)
MHLATRTALINARRSYHRVTAREAIKLQASNIDGVFVDIRHPGSRELVPSGFCQIPHYALETAVGDGTLRSDQPVYLADTWGTHSESAALLLEQRGFTNVNVISGGVVSWGVNGGPVAVMSRKQDVERKYNCKLFSA